MSCINSDVVLVDHFLKVARANRPCLILSHFCKVKIRSWPWYSPFVLLWQLTVAVKLPYMADLYFPALVESLGDMETGLFYLPLTTFRRVVGMLETGLGEKAWQECCCTPKLLGFYN